VKLDDLLNAAVQLEKRIESDRMLRACFSAIWNQTEAQKANRGKKHSATQASPGQSLTLTFSKEFCELLERTAKSTGKSPAEILEESFTEYYLKHFSK
jgi:hypothetical protein